MTSEKKKYFFISDFHLGAPNRQESMIREKKIIKWINNHQHEIKELFIVGDVFDFWFEYKTVIPKGFVRLQGKIAELTDSGTPVHYFTGNHDMWTFTYFQEELGVKMYREPQEFILEGQKFFIGHGDGLGPGDRGYKFIKKVFSNSFAQWLFARLHPNFGIGLANYFSKKSRHANADTDEKFLGEENEWLVQFVKQKLKEDQSIRYFIFGHRHLPLDLQIGKSRYINLGDWIRYNSYAVFDGIDVRLEYYKPG